MRGIILTAAVLFSGVAGGFLLYLAEERLAKAAASDGAAAETAAPIPRPGAERGLVLVCILLCGGAMAAFLELFHHNTVLNTVNVLLLCSVLWPCAWADLRAKLIPNQVLACGFLLRCGVLCAELLLLPQEVLLDLTRSAVAAIVLCIAAVVCRLVVPGAVGFGDVKLLMLMGLFLGTDQVWGCIFFAMLASFVCSAALLLIRRATMKTEIPYAPFLLLGTVAATFLVNV